MIIFMNLSNNMFLTPKWYNWKFFYFLITLYVFSKFYTLLMSLFKIKNDFFIKMQNNKVFLSSSVDTLYKTIHRFQSINLVYQRERNDDLWQIAFVLIFLVIYFVSFWTILLKRKLAASIKETKVYTYFQRHLIAFMDELKGA